MKNEQEIYEVDQLNLLDCKDILFEQEKSGYMTLKLNGKEYKKVNLTRLIPFTSKDEYISLSFENEEKEFREIGVIKNIKEQQAGGNQ